MPKKETVTIAPAQKMMRVYGLKAKKSLGQNFLLDPSYIDRIVEALGAGGQDLVIEVGPGLGALTRPLSQKAGRVLALEVDRRLYDILRVEMKTQENVRIVLEDALSCDVGAMVAQERQTGIFSPGFLACGNLPYYITTPILMRFLESAWDWKRLVFMVQKEVAARMVAPPGGKDYGSLSLAVQYHAQAAITTEVPPEVFYPQPKVYSAVVCLNRLPKPPVQLKEEKKFFTLIKASFGQRRKTILNALSNHTSLSKEQWLSLLKQTGIEPQRRGETLSMEEFASLANNWSDLPDA